MSLPGLALLVVAVAWLLWRLRVAATIARMPALEQAQGPVEEAAELPSASIVAAARDEEGDVEDAVRSWLAQRVPALQVVVVDDRSRDRTGEILRRLAAEDPRLVVVRVEERPAGWLGKCHALHVGLAHASGERVLFTDADVRLDPECLPRALAFCRREGVDHLGIIPRVECDGWLQEGLTALFFQAFLAALAGSPAEPDGRRGVVGVGAFGLVRGEALRACGGFEAIRMQVGEDVALARLLVNGGFAHRLLVGNRWVRLRWQRGVLGTIRGLEKNAFWAMRFSPLVLLAVTLAGIASLAPLAGAVAGGAAGWAAVAAWAAGVVAPYAAVRARGGPPVAVALLHPVSTILLLATFWNSAVATWRRGGISWRGDFVSTQELRAAMLPMNWWFGRLDRAPERAP